MGRGADEMPAKPRLLDLFCGAGGAAKGYQRAGFYVVGVDINPQPHYCGDEFVQMDALAVLDALEANDDGSVFLWGWPRLGSFDIVHASPPCQGYSANMRAHVTRDYPLLIQPVRDRLKETGSPFVIENVRGADLPSAFMLCGSVFGLRVWRHRYFESSEFLLVPPCRHDLGAPLNPYRASSRRRDGLETGAMRAYAAAMEIDWMAKTSEMTEAIPPAYTEWIGSHLLAAVRAVA